MYSLKDAKQDTRPKRVVGLTGSIYKNVTVVILLLEIRGQPVVLIVLMI